MSKDKYPLREISQIRRDEWNEFLRRHADELRAWGVRILRRLWTPTVGSRFRVCAWSAFGGLVAACFICFAVAFWYDRRKHNVAGVPRNHFAVRLDGQPVSVRRGGGPLKQRPQVPLTEQQFWEWEENDSASRSWATRAAVFSVAAVMVFAVGWRVSRPKPGSHRGPDGALAAANRRPAGQSDGC